MREPSNLELSQHDLLFIKACELAGIAPSKRQASKWRNNKGLAFRFRAAASVELQKEEVVAP